MSNAIECEHVTVEIEQQRILDDISFALPQNSLSVVFGPNGAGKSTLINVLTGDISPSSGTVRIHGLNPDDASPLVGYVPQFFSVRSDYPLTVIEAVLMGLYGKKGLRGKITRSDRSAALDAMAVVGIESHAHDRVQSLSGGQLQRMILARALISEPKVLLLDEATSGVDVGVKESLYDLLVKLKSKMTILFVTHDVSVISKDVDLILCLNKSLVSHGSPAEALSDHALQCMYGDGVAIFSHCHAPHVHVHHHGGRDDS